MLLIKHVFIVVVDEVSDSSTGKKLVFCMEHGESLKSFDGFHLLGMIRRSL